jgi:tetratricopeptide (TPR) repeat protein
MNDVRRLKIVGALLALSAIVWASHVWGVSDSNKPSAKKRYSAKNRSSAKLDDDFSEDLANAKFTKGGVLTYRTTGGDLLFALQVKPELKPMPERPRDYLVMVDTSASQVKAPLATARQITEALVKGVGEQDRLAIWTVNTPKATRDLTSGFQSGHSPRIQEALKALRQEVPVGNTDLKGGLKRAIASFQRVPERQQVLLFLGDGMSSYDPLSNADRSALGEDMVKNSVSFFPIPLGPQLDSKNLHGLATSSGGAVVRMLPKDKLADTMKRLHEAVATPVLYPRNFKLGAEVAEAFPTTLPPLRADAPTLVVGKLNDSKSLTYTLEGTVAGTEVRLQPVEAIGESEADNFFLVGMVEQWKNARDEPSPYRADRVLAYAYEQSQLVRADLIAQAEWALGQDKLDVALELFDKAKKLDPQDAEADAGMKIVQRLKAGKIKKDELKELLAKEDKEAGLKQLAQAGGQAQPPRELAPPTEPEDLLRQQRARLAVEEQRVMTNVDDALREARRVLRSDPDQAHELLKRMYATVRENPDISDRTRQLLSSRLESALREVDTQGARIKRDKEEQLRQLADARRRFDLETGRVAEEERIRRRLLQFSNLMAQARYEDAYLQALAIQQDAITTGKGVPVAASAGYDIGLAANNLSQIQELHRVREERYLLTMMQVERSAVPFPDEPPIQFPPAATWREITRLRKEKYESSGFTEDDPATLQSIRNLKNKLSRPVDLEKGLDANTPLREVLEFLTDRYDVTILIDVGAFKAEGKVEDVEVAPIKLPRMKGVSLATVLRLITGQIDGTYLIRRDYIEITTGARAVAEKVLRVYPVADIVTPIPNSFNSRAVAGMLNILGTLPGLGLNLGGPIGLAAIGQGLGIGGAVGLGAIGLGGGLGLGGLGALGLGGGLGLGGLGGGLGGIGGGLAGVGGGIGGVGGGLGFGGGPALNLGVGGGQLGFGGGQLGQLGNLGGQFGIQGGDQSAILVELIRQVVGNYKEWQAPGRYQGLQAMQLRGAVNPADTEEEGEKNPIELLNSLGYYPPARALVVKGTSRIHTNIGGGLLTKPGAIGGMGALDQQLDGKLVIAPKAVRDKLAAAQPPKEEKKEKDRNQLPFQKMTPEELAKKDPTKIWQEALENNQVTDPGLIIACADFLADVGFNDHLAEFLKANLRLGIVVRPWVYESLALALEASNGSPDEIERVRLSAVDLEPQSARSYVQAAKDMAQLKRYDRAVAFCRQAALLDPNTAYPYEEAMIIAELAKDANAMEWAAGGLLRQDWPTDNQDLQLKARSKLKDLAAVLSHDRRDADAERMLQSVEQLRIRDLVIELTWQGEADLDLEVREPIGSLCSFLQRQTPGGGILLGDTVTDSTRESYVAAKAFSGDYQITIRRIWGRPLGGKASLKIIQHQGTPRQTERWETFVFDRNQTLTVSLDDGRRTSAEYVPPPAARRSESVAEKESPDRVLNKLRALADPEYVGTEARAGGGFASLGTPSAPRHMPKLPDPQKQDPIFYQTKVPALANSGFELMAQVIDAREGMVKLSPVFQSVNHARSQPVVNNPLIPGAGDGTR